MELSHEDVNKVHFVLQILERPFGFLVVLEDDHVLPYIGCLKQMVPQGVKGLLDLLENVVLDVLKMYLSFVIADYD